MKKRVFCLLLSLALVFSCAAPVFAKEETTLPVIMVAGYGSSSLYTDYGTAEEKKVWNTILDDLPSALLKDLPNVLLALVKTIFGNPQALGAQVGKLIAQGAADVACKPDGTGAVETAYYPNDPARSTFTYLTEKNDGQEMAEWDYAKDIAAKYGGDRVFFYHTDFRMGAIENAEVLSEYVNDIIEYTGDKKVKIFALSHGGQITGTYLSLHGTEGKVDRAVLAMPALCGTDVAYDILTGSVTLADRDLIGFLDTALCSTALSTPLGLEKLFKNDDGLACLDSLAAAAINELSPVVRYWTSLWDFLPTDKYEELKPLLLDSTASAKIIENSDRMHYEIMPNFGKAFEACRDAGVDISILSGMGLKIALGSTEDSDCIISTASATGARCAAFGEKLNSAGAPEGAACTDKAHNHLSPDRTVDASYAFLPENTWFVDELYHGMYYFEEYTLSLVNKLMFTDEIDDIYSDKNYPQFTPSGHSYLAVGAKIENNTLVITNNTEQTILLLGIEGDFSAKTLGTSIKAGESFGFTLPEDRDRDLEIKISYFRLGALSPFGTRETAVRG